MGDTTVKKIDSKQSPRGKDGQIYLATGKSISMRLWQEEPCDEEKQSTRRAYETVGYVISGAAELHLEGQMVKLNQGDSWLVPKDAEHSYKIIESFTAVEATHPPAEIHGRDQKKDECDAKSQNEGAKGESCETNSQDKNGDGKSCDAGAQNSGKKDGVKSDERNDKAGPDKEEAAAKAEKAQEIAAKLPRENDEVTSNAEPRKPEPAEHIKVESQK